MRSAIVFGFVLTSSLVMAAPMELDVFTNFETINTQAGVPFTLRDASAAAELSGDAFSGVIGVPELYFSGTHAWMVNPGGTGLIQFEPNAAEVEFWARARSFANGPTVISAIDDQGQVIDSITLVGRDPFQLVSFNGNIDRIEVVNNATGSRQLNAIDDFGFSPLGIPLQAGDADQDFDFDQFDLIQVQQAAKFLTGQSATWGEGDWNGAPGGRQGSPPIGNGRFDQFDIISALSAGVFLTGPYAAVSASGQQGDAQTSVAYDARNGEIWIDAPAGIELTSINIESAAGIFTGNAAENLGGSFDNDADDNIFKATFGSSFGSISFGNVAQPSLTEDFLLNDLAVVGSLAGGGGLGDVDLVYVPVPEPTSILLLVVGLASFLRFGWYRRSLDIAAWLRAWVLKHGEKNIFRARRNPQRPAINDWQTTADAVANLNSAVLRRADLSGVDLRGCILAQADLSDARLQRTNLCGADLRRVKGLTADQLNQALIDHQTQVPDYLASFFSCRNEPQDFPQPGGFLPNELESGIQDDGAARA